MSETTKPTGDLCEYDYTEQDVVVPTNEIAAELHKLVERHRKATRDVAEAEVKLNASTEDLRLLEETLIPERMKSLGTEIYRLPQDGTTITMARKVRASITEINKEAAHKWLDDNGHGGMVKRTIVVAFNKDQEEAAKKLREELSPRYAGVRQDVDIHWMTLSTWAKNRLEAGETIPDCITTFDTKVAKIK